VPAASLAAALAALASTSERSGGGTATAVVASERPVDVPVRVGEFRFVENSRWSESLHTCDNPRCWMGRVVKVSAKGKVKLQWYRYAHCRRCCCFSVCLFVLCITCGFD
jgi:hypothetical protein